MAVRRISFLGVAIFLVVIGWAFFLKQNSKITVKTPRYAFATLLCDDVMSEAIRVLLGSFKEHHGDRFPFLLLVLPAVKDRADLQRLGAIIHEIDALDYPFRVTAEKAAINKQCRYSKLHIWRYTDYEKIVFVDVDTLVLGPLDNVFSQAGDAEFAAVRDAGDTFNTGLFVLRPSLSTWKEMSSNYLNAPSYNQGDQGFLNWFFRDRPKAVLPVMYNTVCKARGTAMWPIQLSQAKLLHFTSETKPWNFFLGAHRSWKLNFESSAFYQWTRAWRKLSKELAVDAHDINLLRWRNSDRTEFVCERFIRDRKALIKRGLFKKKAGLTVLITSWKSPGSLVNAAKHYEEMDLIQKVMVSWDPWRGIPSPQLLHKLNGIDLIMHRFHSGSNQFAPIAGLETSIIFLADDEHLVLQEQLELAMESTKNNPMGLVGFFGRFHNIAASRNITLPDEITAPIVQESVWKRTWNVAKSGTAKRPRPFSLISSRLLMLHADHLFTYSCLLPDRLHRLVDEQSAASLGISQFPKEAFSSTMEREHFVQFAAAELLMNVMVAGMTAQRPLLIRTSFLDPDETIKRLLEKNNVTILLGHVWPQARGTILRDILRDLPGTTQAKERDLLGLLHYNSLAVMPFNKIPFKKRSEKQWNRKD